MASAPRLLLAPSLAAARLAPRAGASAAAAAAAPRRWQSSAPPGGGGASAKDKEESERVHGALDSSQVRSKAMRARLARQERQGSSLQRQEQPPEEDLPQQQEQPQQQYQQQQQQQQGAAPSFGTVMWHNVVAGFGMAIAFSLVGLAFRAAFGGGSSGARPAPPARAAPPPQPHAPLEAGPWVDDEVGGGGGDFSRDEGDQDPYARRTQQGVAQGAGRPRGVAL